MCPSWHTAVRNSGIRQINQSRPFTTLFNSKFLSNELLKKMETKLDWLGDRLFSWIRPIWFLSDVQEAEVRRELLTFQIPSYLNKSLDALGE